MREPVEVGRRALFGPGSRRSGSRALRLLLPSAGSGADIGGGLRIQGDGAAGPLSDRRNLALVSMVELELARPSAVVVMRQLLDAWRSAERLLDAASDASPERRELQTQVATLRALYQGLFAYVRHARVERVARLTVLPRVP